MKLQTVRRCLLRPSILPVLLIFISCISHVSCSSSFITNATGTGNNDTTHNTNADLLQTPLPFTDITVPLLAKQFSHHVHIYVGYPPQRRIVIVDTGSRVLLFPCDPCAACGSKHVSGLPFSSKISTTDMVNDCNTCVLKSVVTKCLQDTCTFHQSYTEGSKVTGHEVEDIVWFGTDNIQQSTKVYMHNAVPLTFGCQSQETGLIANQFADGIMGLSFREDNIISKMYDAGLIQRNAFSLCFMRTGGVFSIGGTSLLVYGEKAESDIVGDNADKPRHLEKMHMVSLVLRPQVAYYTIFIQGFKVGGISIASKEKINAVFNENGKGTIIDSGTTDTYLPAQISKEFRKVWTTLTSTNHHNTLSTYNYEEFHRLPNITLVLEGNYEWTIEPNEYMEADGTDSSSWNESGSRRFTNRIYVDEPKGAVLGANAMFNHDILFDITMGMVGIAKANCWMNQ